MVCSAAEVCRGNVKHICEIVRSGTQSLPEIVVEGQDSRLDVSS